eukprot:gene12171-5661_t
MELVTLPNTCTFRNFGLANAIGSLVSPILIFGIFLFNTALITFDIVLFVKENGCRVKSYFFTDDPYGFRIEFFASSITMTIAGVFTTIPVVMYFLNRTLSSDATETSNQLRFSTLVIVVFIAEITLILTLYSIGLLYAIINKIKQVIRPRIFDSEFEAFVNTKQGKEIFKKYAKKE